MGMYASGPYLGEEFKLTGLLATCVVEAAQAKFNGLQYEGVELTEDGYIDGGVVVLQREEVNQVVNLMRVKFLDDGQVSKYNDWYCSIHDTKPNPFYSLVNLQDILSFQGDVAKFSGLVHWLACTNEEEIVWA